MITEAELDAIEARVSAALPGPWHQGRTGEIRAGRTCPVCDAESCYEIYTLDGELVADGANDCHTNQFIAHSRVDVERLIIEVHQAQAMIQHQKLVIKAVKDLVGVEMLSRMLHEVGM